MGFWWIVEDIVYCITRVIHICNQITKIQNQPITITVTAVYATTTPSPSWAIPIHYNLALLTKYFEIDVFFLPFRLSSLRRLSKLGPYTAALYLTVEVQCVVTVCEVMSDC